MSCISAISYFSLNKQSGGGLPWFGFVQDYIPGASLQQWLDQGKRFTEVQVRQIATEVLENTTDWISANKS